MSDKSDSSLARHDSQAKTPGKSDSDQLQNLNHQDTPEELVHLQCVYYRRLNALLSQKSAEKLGERLENIARGSFMPASGFGDVLTLAGLMNLDERTVFDQLKKTKHEQLGFGRTVF